MVDAQQERGQQQTPAEAAQINAAPLIHNSGIGLLLIRGQGAHVIGYELRPVAHVGAVRHARDQGGGNAAASWAALHHVVEM